MKQLLTPFLFLLPVLLSAQAVDSITIRQVDSLIQVSRDLTKKRDYEQALEVNAVAEKLALEKLGKESAEYGSCCFNQGRVLYFSGDYPEAEKWYLEAKAIREKAPGKEHPDYASSLSYLGILYQTMVQYEKAEPPYLEVIAIQEKTLGKEHPDYALSLNDLGILYTFMAQYEKAEPLYLKSKTILKKNLGKGHPNYCGTLINLATLYQTMGQYEKAEPLYLEAMDIFKNLLNNREHPYYSNCIINLGLLYQTMGQYEKAEPILLEAEIMQKKTLGKEHPDYAFSLQSLGVLYTKMGQYKKAELLFLEAKTIKEKVLGKEHPNYAISLENLASLYLTMGQYKKAEPLLQELPLVDKRLIEQAMHHLSESELNNYLDKFSYSQNQTLSFTQIAGSKKMVPVCYDNSLFYKGFLLQSASRIKQLALSDKGVAEKYIRLKGYQRRLAIQYAQPIAERDSALVVRLETQANNLEKDLTRTVSGWGEARRQVQWQEVQATLQEGAIAVEFVHYRYYGKKQTDSTMYAALVLQPGKEQPQFIPLFEEKQLDSLLQTQGGRKADYVNSLYSVAERGARPLDQPQQSLYELIWQPLEQATEDVSTIYFSPSGLLHRLNLSAIPISEEETLGDRYRLIGLNSTRQLVIPIKVEAAAQDAMLFGGVEYEMDTTAIVMTNKNYDTNLLATRGGISFSYADSTSRGGSWNYLKWTNTEVDKIGELLADAGFQMDDRKGYAATEESFKAIDQGGTSPRILHIATHGFFFPDPVIEGSERISMDNEEPVFKMSDHPMIRSGLILAGGNHAWNTGKPIQPDMEDGILTAYEISQMNLSNTELVVLSACETGLGDIKGNEGVYGLQRAFKIAGAKYLIMSLWQVPDRETAFFMEAFYRNWLEKEMTIPEAFRTTQQELRENPFITPYQWAGFVLVE